MYKGKAGPTARHIRIARTLFDKVDLPDLARKLSRAPLCMLQQVSFLLALLFRVSRPKFRKLAGLIDWDAIGATIGEHWKHLPHDAEVLIGVAACTPESRANVASFVRRNVDRMAIMPARLALIAPDTAIVFVREGRSIALAQFSHVEWRYGAFVIALFSEKAPDLLPSILGQCIPTIAEAVSAAHESWYRESAPMLEAMLAHAPESLRQVLDLVNVDKAAIGWKTALKAGGGSRKTVDVLLRAAKERTDALGDLARQLAGCRKKKHTATAVTTDSPPPAAIHEPDTAPRSTRSSTGRRSR